MESWEFYAETPRLRTGKYHIDQTELNSFGIMNPSVGHTYSVDLNNGTSLNVLIEQHIEGTNNNHDHMHRRMSGTDIYACNVYSDE